MLAIRLQRLGRKRMPIYRIAVQESHRHPSSGRVIAYVGRYNPHDKYVEFDHEKVAFYLNNGAQPSPRITRLLEEQKIELPSWVKKSTKKQGVIRNQDKLRKNQVAEESVAEETPAEAAPEAEAATPEKSEE